MTDLRSIIKSRASELQGQGKQSNASASNANASLAGAMTPAAKEANEKRAGLGLSLRPAQNKAHM